jgi:hypothetical protein
MIAKKITLLLITIIISCAASTFIKKPKTKWSAELKEKKGVKLNGIISSNENGIYTLHSFKKKQVWNNSFWDAILSNVHKVNNQWGNGTKFILKQFDYNLKEVKSNLIELKNDKKQRLIEYVVNFGGEVRLFTSYVSEKNNKKYLFVETLNLKTLSSKNDIQKVSEVAFSKVRKKKLYNAFFGFELSGDSSKLLIYSSLPKEEDDKQRFSCTVLNEQFKVLWQNQIKLPYEDKLFSTVDYTVSSKGDVYILGKLYSEKRRNIKNNEINFKHQVIGFKRFGKEKTIYDFQLKDKLITEINISLNKDENIVCVGFYSTGKIKLNKQKSARLKLTPSVDGVYTMLIDEKTKEILYKKTYNFLNDFYLEDKSAKRSIKAEKRLEKGKEVDVRLFQIDRLIDKKDGGMMLIGEQFRSYSETHKISVGGSTQTNHTAHYIYSSIIVVSISLNGDIEWFKMIPKHQHTMNDGGYFSSYSVMEQEDKLHFYYNDHVDNINIKDNKGEVVTWRNKALKNTALMQATIDKEGNLERVFINNAKSADILTKPLHCEQLNQHQILLYGEKKGGKYRVGLLTP